MPILSPFSFSLIFSYCPFSIIFPSDLQFYETTILMKSLFNLVCFDSRLPRVDPSRITAIFFSSKTTYSLPFQPIMSDFIFGPISDLKSMCSTGKIYRTNFLTRLNVYQVRYTVH